MRASRIYIVDLWYKVIGMVATALEHSQEKNSGTRNQALDLPVIDNVL